MVDIRALHAAGYTVEKLRQLFVPDGGHAARDPKIQRLLDLTTSRIREGVNRNITHARHWWVIDQACDVSEYSMSPTMMRGLKSKHQNPEALMKAMQDFGLSSLIRQSVDGSGNKRVDASGRPIMMIDDAPLVEVVAPICQQYLNARWATLVTGRESSPWLKYSPLVYSRKNHLKTSIITSRAEQMVHEMGYRADFRQEVLGALKYGYQFVFAREPYYWEKQSFMGDGGVSERTVRSGIRQTMPHPSRTFFDLANRMATLNTNTGFEYAGYWDTFRWGSVRDNKQYWLTDEQRGGKIGYGLSIEESSWSQFNQLFPCAMAFPSDLFYNKSRSDKDRTSEGFRVTYNNDDSGVVVSHIYQKIIPSDWGLFDYNYPVWFCFVMANGDTPLLVEPYAYTPVRVTQYQGDQNHWRPPSMVTDLIPFQDSVGNLITHYLMTVRRNLMNLIYYNSDTVERKHIEQLLYQTSGLWAGPNFVPTSYKEAQLDATTAQISDQFKAVVFPQGDAISVVNAINTMLGIVERVIGFTAQEVGTTGTHIQTAEEIRVMTDFANNRIALTDAFIDSSIGAFKGQIYDAFMNYDDDLIMGSIADISDVDANELAAMGVLVESGPSRKAGVMADRSALQLASFSADREGSRRTNDAQIATALMQFAQTVFSVPQIAEGMGIPAVVEAFNTVAQFAGLPPEARIKISTGQSPQQMSEQAMLQIKQMTEQIMAGHFEEVGKGLRVEVIEPINAAIEAIANRTQKIESVLSQLIQGSVVAP